MLCAVIGWCFCADPKHTMIPISLHAIGMEKYVPRLVLANLDSTAFLRLTEADLQRMEVPPADRRRIVELLRKLNEQGGDINLEGTVLPLAASLRGGRRAGSDAA